jgi:hypothetical protein
MPGMCQFFDRLSVHAAGGEKGGWQSSPEIVRNSAAEGKVVGVSPSKQRLVVAEYDVRTDSEWDAINDAERTGAGAVLKKWRWETAWMETWGGERLTLREDCKVQPRSGRRGSKVQM